MKPIAVNCGELTPNASIVNRTIYPTFAPEPSETLDHP